ncbi:hypothetical protein [Rhizobium sp. BK491]|uniref:hypothetical protein n=1 Tax=Rhizobium sp. BK491 TaxID=2587009 RepID=UPI001620F1B6|nr:hypothetical protein [Rhizobium sp. BK491]MBB3566089.1 hypothetical protein [Rhizobium sp. BK491]
MENNTSTTGEATPREQVLDLIASAIRSAKTHEGEVDFEQEAIILLDELERRAIGIDTGTDGSAILIFCDPNMPVDFIEGGA